MTKNYSLRKKNHFTLAYINFFLYLCAELVCDYVKKNSHIFAYLVGNRCSAHVCR